MGIQVEFNPDLALRRYKTKRRKPEECFPIRLEIDKVYRFLKEGQRNYWFQGEIPLLVTEGNQQLSRPQASVVILEATHFLRDGEIYTKGLFKVIEVYNTNKDKTTHFDGFAKR